MQILNLLTKHMMIILTLLSFMYSFNIAMTSAENDILSVTGKITNQTNSKKLPTELKINLYSITESGEKYEQETVAKNGYFIFFIKDNEESIYFLETIYQDIKYASDFYNKKEATTSNITIDIYEKDQSIPNLEIIVSKITLSKINYDTKQLSFIREDILRNHSSWTYYNDNVLPTYQINLFDNTLSAVGNIGSGVFYKDIKMLNVFMPVKPGLNSISTIHTVQMEEKNSYKLNYTSNYRTKILEIMVPKRFSKIIKYDDGFFYQGNISIQKEQLSVFRRENIESNKSTSLIINNIFNSTRASFLENKLIIVTSLFSSIVIAIGVILTIGKSKNKTQFKSKNIE
jgi:hypothetical protein